MQFRQKKTNLIFKNLTLKDLLIKSNQIFWNNFDYLVCLIKITQNLNLLKKYFGPWKNNMVKSETKSGKNH